MRNIELASVLQNDPSRLKQRTVKPKKGKGKKKRARESKSREERSRAMNFVQDVEKLEALITSMKYCASDDRYQFGTMVRAQLNEIMTRLLTDKHEMLAAKIRGYNGPSNY